MLMLCFFVSFLKYNFSKTFIICQSCFNLIGFKLLGNKKYTKFLERAICLKKKFFKGKEYRCNTYFRLKTNLIYYVKNLDFINGCNKNSCR